MWTNKLFIYWKKTGKFLSYNFTIYINQFYFIFKFVLQVDGCWTFCVILFQIWSKRLFMLQDVVSVVGLNVFS